MSLIETVAEDRPEHPVDVVERLAAVNEWTFDRAEDDEISILVSGDWANYDLAFTWIPDIESLHVACSFDLKAPPRKRARDRRARPSSSTSSCGSAISTCGASRTW